MDTHTGWMMHSCQMAQSRLDGEAARGGADSALLTALDYEVRVRWFVLAHVHQVGALRGEARVWYVYMACHAHLQMRRYGRQISEGTFRRTCARLRGERDQRLKSATGRWFDEIAA